MELCTFFIECKLSIWHWNDIDTCVTSLWKYKVNFQK